MTEALATGYAAWLYVTGLAALGIAHFVWRRRGAPGAGPLAFLLLALAQWSLTYALHWDSPSPRLQQFWLDATFFGVVSAPVCVWLFTRAFTQPNRPMHAGAWVTLLAVPVATWGLLLAGDPGGVLFGQLGTLEAHTRLQGGPGFTVVVVHGYGLMLLSALRLALFFRSATDPYRRQAGILLAGLGLPWIVNLVSVLGLSPFPELDLTPMLFLITALVFLWGLLGFQLFDLVPIARHQVIEQMGEGVVVLDRAGRLVDLNPVARQLADPALPTPLGHPAERVFEQWGVAAASLGALTGGREAASAELTLGEQHLEVRVTPLRDARRQVQGHIVVWRDVTAQREAEAELRLAHEQLQLRMAEIEHLQHALREQSIRDPLTGLYNRRYLQEALLSAQDSPFSVVLFDLDHFKAVNDLAGHAGGDAVLRQVAACLQASRQPGETICRYGGEEFIVVLPGLDSAAAVRRAEQWRTEIGAQQVTHGAHLLRVSISLGVASFPQHGPDLDSVLLAADQALYQAKTQGRDRWVLAAPVV
ncbi:GGDEF domain-containing protein [Deinococcus aerolatus]|uniref:GGDEF domain-containing protein n=1 Tax=Deinococcus aerolatus TaxID=522487 RepID=A0ABQ2GF69_9DEIO|nr:histidine kinase N-terminal 7TM domain-containing protein [Deinococcus aerolatus]GGL93513.1 GGDEF domain-containing protein [Deinococcus aerolatus]